MSTKWGWVTGVLALGLLPVPTPGQIPATHPFRAEFAALPRLAMDTEVVQVDRGVALGMVSAVTGDASGRLYVLHRPESGDPVIVLDRSGRLLDSWGEGLFESPHGIRVDPSGHIWTVDATKSTILKFDHAGTLLLEIELDRPTIRDVFCGATDVAFGPAGLVYVSDGYCNGRIVVLNPDGQVVREWGTVGTEEGSLRIPHAIAVGPDGLIYVADRENGRIQRFDPDGTLVGVWQFAGQLLSLAFGNDGDLFASLSLGGGPVDAHVVKLDPETGVMVARIEVVAHELDVAPDGTLLPGTSRSEVVLVRPR